MEEAAEGQKVPGSSLCLFRSTSLDPLVVAAALSAFVDWGGGRAFSGPLPGEFLSAGPLLSANGTSLATPLKAAETSTFSQRPARRTASGRFYSY